MKFEVGEVYIDHTEHYFQVFKVVKTSRRKILAESIKQSSILSKNRFVFNRSSFVAANSKLLTNEERAELL